MRSMFALAAVAAAATFQLGCGPCQQIAAHRDAFQAREATSGAAPHLAISIPQSLINDAMSAGLARIRPKELDLPGMGQIARYVDKMSFAPKRIGIERAANSKDQYRIAMDLDVGLGSSSLFVMTLATQTAPLINREKGEVELALRADMLESLTPSIPDAAVSRLTSALLSKVPAAVRALLPRSEIDRLSRGAIQYVSQNAVRLLRSQILTPMGQLASFRFKMPDLPLASLEMVSQSGRFDILARTTLPVQRGLGTLPSAAASRSRVGAADSIQVRVATGAVVELANWAMGRGELPNAFDMNGKPTPGGSFSAGLEWASGESPLKINAWSAQGTCIRARIGANPLVALRDGKLDLGVQGVKIEELEGPPLLKEATQWATSLWDNSVGASKTRISTAKFGLGGDKAGGMDLASVALEGDALVFSLKTGGSAANTRQRKRTAPVIKKGTRSQLWSPAPGARCGG